MSNLSTTQQRQQIEALDGFRGIAILLVMWFHIWEISWLSHDVKLFGHSWNLDFLPIAGFLGVDLFFFISAFCLYYPYARHVTDKRPLPSLKHFAYRRAIKILPSYYLAILIIFLFATPSFPSVKNMLWHLMTHFLFIHDWYLTTKNSIIGVLWSLGVEVQFYLLFPLFCWCFRRKPFLTYALMSGAAVAYRLYLKHHTPERFDFLIDHLPGFLDLFAGGMLAAYLFVWLQNYANRFVHMKRHFTAFAVGMALILLTFMGWLYAIRYDPKGIEYWEADNRVFVALIFTLLILSTCFSAHYWIKLIANRVFVFLSVISYNLYIWHQTIARKLVEWRIPGYIGDDPHADHTWQILFTIASVLASVIFAAIITYKFERPLLKKGVRRSWRDLLSFIGGNKSLRDEKPQKEVGAQR